jgi:hypothetical protein
MSLTAAHGRDPPTLQLYGNDANESTNCPVLFSLSSHSLHTLFTLSSHSLPLSSTNRYGNDANESTNVATANPTIVATLKARLAAIEATEWDPPAPAANSGAACAVANGKYGGVIGPWQ